MSVVAILLACDLDDRIRETKIELTCSYDSIAHGYDISVNGENQDFEGACMRNAFYTMPHCFI